MCQALPTKVRYQRVIGILREFAVYITTCLQEQSQEVIKVLLCGYYENRPSRSIWKVQVWLKLKEGFNQLQIISSHSEVQGRGH
mmetsp:Transcript_16295/g.33539  ORF Transcript_16295/g.33539 Transcript_16295/m.33539 type:complete len:84 (+) Transcript_16295:148-399(+)